VAVTAACGVAACCVKSIPKPFTQPAARSCSQIPNALGRGGSSA